jgi:nucleoside-diphosphate-sugar epimerase
LLNGETEIKLGDTSPTRDLLFVKDTVRGFLAIASSEKLIGHDCNIATQSEISVGELANELIQQINPAAKVISDEQRIRPEKSEVFRLYGSNEKIKQYTNWKPLYTLNTGLSETIQWFKNPANLEKYKSNIYNI